MGYNWQQNLITSVEIAAKGVNSMVKTICIANQKGGVGKTTSSVNLAAALGSLNQRVLILDMDPQGNASSGLGVKRYENQENNIYHVLIGEKNLIEVAQKTEEDNLWIAPANPDLVGAEIELVDMAHREYRLKEAIQSVASQFHFVIIDCPPSLGLLTVNSLTAADTFLVPLQCEYYALEGLSQLLNTASLIKKNLNPQLRIEGIVLTMFDTRNNLSHQVVSEIQSYFKEKVFKSIIPRNVRLSEAPSHGQSILRYDAKSIGARKYLELAREVLARSSHPVAADSGEDLVNSDTQASQHSQLSSQKGHLTTQGDHLNSQMSSQKGSQMDSRLAQDQYYADELRSKSRLSSVQPAEELALKNYRSDLGFADSELEEGDQHV